jgi:hypothetical protein
MICSGRSVHVDSLARRPVPEAGDEDAAGAQALADDPADVHRADVRRAVRHADDDAGPAKHELELAERVDALRLGRGGRRSAEGRQRSDQETAAIDHATRAQRQLFLGASWGPRGCTGSRQNMAWPPSLSGGDGKDVDRGGESEDTSASATGS